MTAIGKPDRFYDKGGRKPQFMDLENACSFNGCHDPALVVPVLKIPVLGVAILKPYEIMIDRQVCRAHLRAFDPRQLCLGRDIRGGAKHFMRIAGVEPDFERAYIDELHIMSKEYRDHCRVLRGEANEAELDKGVGTGGGDVVLWRTGP